eukprot:2315823-Prymnesium_polylepis.1
MLGGGGGGVGGAALGQKGDVVCHILARGLLTLCVKQWMLFAVPVKNLAKRRHRKLVSCRAGGAGPGGCSAEPGPAETHRATTFRELVTSARPRSSHGMMDRTASADTSRLIHDGGHSPARALRADPATSLAHQVRCAPRAARRVPLEDSRPCGD